MVIGIDLGTTNSLVSVWKNDRLEIIPNRFGENLTPSVVSFDRDGMVYVGKTAKERLVTNPDVTFKEFKRNLGRKHVYTAYRKGYKPEELSALVLKQLKEDAEEYLNEPVTEAVISVPAYFTDQQRASTRNAGILAGLKIERLINEPSAAALAYHVHNIEQNEIFIVFDFGGGTLDVSLVDAFENIIEIQAVSGDNCLGGKDFNEIIALDICNKNNLVWSRLDASAKEILYREAENIKIALTSDNEVSAIVRINETEYPYTIDNQELINLSADLFKRITKVLQHLMNDAHVSVDDISNVVMVGGSSRMPVVRAYISSLFEGKLIDGGNPDEIICTGAGIVSGIKERNGNIRDLILSDICPFTLGIEVIGGVMSPIISKNQILPCSRQGSYYTTEDNQKKLRISVYQGENITARDNTMLDEFCINIPPKKKGEVWIDVRFSYDINGIFDIDVYCPLTKQHVTRSLGTSSGMSETELADRKKELEKIKIHPKDIEKNKYILERAQRLFKECNEEQKGMLGPAIVRFVDALDSQDLKRADTAYREFELQIAMVESTLFHFGDFDVDLWNQIIEDNDDGTESD